MEKQIAIVPLSRFGSIKNATNTFWKRRAWLLTATSTHVDPSLVPCMWQIRRGARDLVWSRRQDIKSLV